jgi:hypothetical protein
MSVRVFFEILWVTKNTNKYIIQTGKLKTVSRVSIKNKKKMKKTIQTIALCIITASCIAISTSSCTKPLKDTTVVAVEDVPQASKSVPISCKFNGNNTELGCTNEMGFCIKSLANLEELDALTLAADESKGQGWARKQANGNILITLSLGTTNISTNLLAQWLDLKTMTITSECLIPNAVVEHCLRTDKITFPPNARVAIPKGTHPLTVTLPAGSNKTPEVVLVLTLSAECKLIGHVTLLR